MPNRVTSFAPGPSMLPDEVIHAYRSAIKQYSNTGLGILELGHRTKEFDNLFETTIEKLRTLIGVPAGYELLLLHGGARFQFTMLPANHLGEHITADYLDTGHFAAAAAAEATVYGNVHIAASTRGDGYSRLPSIDEISHTPTARYLHYTSNNTEIGTQFRRQPTVPIGTWLACDASSDLLIRPFDVASHGIIYATSHKNLGTAGCALVILKADLLDAVRPLPPYMSYLTHAKAASRFNTPPVSAIYVLSLMAQWTAESGGVFAMNALSTAKACLLYRVIDVSDFYIGLASRDDRSKVNVTFALPTPELEAEFQEAAAQQGLVGLWGYRKVGHLRASLFNAVPIEAVERLAEFMESFAKSWRAKIPAQPTDLADLART